LVKLRGARRSATPIQNCAAADFINREFTLVVTLAVIAMIAIIAALLLAALTTARPVGNGK
jgi:hypothetical protein